MAEEYQTTPGSLNLLHPAMNHNDQQEQEWVDSKDTQTEQESNA